jgi:septum site-determining protein MinD
LFKIIAIHSFLGGAGKSHITANVAALLAAEGWRVGVIDTDLPCPSLHYLFGLDERKAKYTLNDYLLGDCDIEEAAYDVTELVGPALAGRIFLVPASVGSRRITQVLRKGYDLAKLNDGFQQLIKAYELHALLIDTHAGLNEPMLLSLAVADSVAMVLQLDKQGYQGTGVTVEIARSLEVPRLVLVVNQLSHTYDTKLVKHEIERAYRSEVAGVLPYFEEMSLLASGGIFVLHYPNHAMTTLLRELTVRLVA